MYQFQMSKLVRGPAISCATCNTWQFEERAYLPKSEQFQTI